MGEWEMKRVREYESVWERVSEKEREILSVCV